MTGHPSLVVAQSLHLRDAAFGGVCVARLEGIAHCRLVKIGLFFFQAEDGIRDDLVTEVQTCALPIYVRFIAIFKPAFKFSPSSSRPQAGKTASARSAKLCRSRAGNNGTFQRGQGPCLGTARKK